MQDDAPRDESVPARPQRWGRFVDMGAMGQAAVTGAYAWAVSVAPIAWGHGASLLAKVAAACALFALGVGMVVSRRSRGAVVNPAVFWAFVISSAAVWVSSPTAMTSVVHMNLGRGIASILGWALFAHTCAAPAMVKSESVRTESIGPRVRAVPFQGSSRWILVIALGALALQSLGWNQLESERAVLIRVVTLACGVALIGGAAFAVSRPPKSEARGRMPLAWFAVLVALVVGGAWWLR